jgi:hypothetical protein
METFTVALVVWFSFANPDFGDGFREARTPGLTEDECKAAAKLGHYPLANAPSAAGYRAQAGLSFRVAWYNNS